MLRQTLAAQKQAAPQPSTSEPQDFRNSVKELYRKAKSRSPDAAKAVITVETMAEVIRISTASTLMELSRELKDAAEIVQAEDSSISVKAACELFLCFVTRTQLDLEQLSLVKERLLERGDRFAQVSIRARQAIAETGAQLIRDGQTILTHGYSRCVKELLEAAIKANKRFKVITTVGRPVLDHTERPRGDGYKMAEELGQLGVSVHVIEDNYVAIIMEGVNMVLVGAEGVMENGGILNKVGTLTVATAAKAYHKPVYVAAESYKFARVFPLCQNDPGLKDFLKVCTLGYAATLPPSVTDKMYILDYTPPKLITYLLTDLGIMTTHTVSAELLNLYS